MDREPSELSIYLLRLAGRFRWSKNQIDNNLFFFLFWKGNPPKLIRDGAILAFVMTKFQPLKKSVRILIFSWTI